MILVSACLLGIDCKYDGSNNLSHDVLGFLRDEGCFIASCPELLGGLSIPRGPYEIMDGTGKEVLEGAARVVSGKGEDVTEEFLRGARETLRVVKRNGVKLAVLKAGSPSCGVGRIYDGTFSGGLIKGDGVTAALLRKEGVRLISDRKLGRCQI